MANNSTATALLEDVAQVENTQPQATEATAPATTPMGTAPSAPANAAPVVQRVGTDLTPELQPVSGDEVRPEVENGRAYEITYIVVANNPDALQSAQDRVKAAIEGGGGAVDHVRVSEVRRLSYPIAKRTEGIYVVTNARFQKSLTENLERLFKLDENVLRHIILREDA